MDDIQQLDYLKCPFWLNHSVEPKLGNPGCSRAGTTPRRHTENYKAIVGVRTENILAIY